MTVVLNSNNRDRRKESEREGGEGVQGGMGLHCLLLGDRHMRGEDE